MDAYALRILFGAVFLAMGGYYAYLSAATAGRHDKVGHLLNVVMCGSMVAMVSPWGHVIPPIINIQVFTAAALWFVYLALFAPGASHTPWFHALKMLAMVWMAVAMTLRPAGTSGGGHDMSAMGSPAVVQAGTPSWSAGVTALVALALLAGAIRASARLGTDFAKAAPAQQLRVLADGSLALGMAMALVVL